MFKTRTTKVCVFSPFLQLGAYCGAPKGKEKWSYGTPGNAPGGSAPGENCVRETGKVRVPESCIEMLKIGTLHEKRAFQQFYEGAGAGFTRKLQAGSNEINNINKILS